MKTTGFAFRKGDISFETGQIQLYCVTNDIPYKYLDKGQSLPEGFIPSGGVEWCESLLGNRVTPSYYPPFLKEHLHRKVWESKKWLYEERVFVKPADRYKRFTGFVKRVCSYKGKKRPPYWYSEPVVFTNEWRYYVANGKILDACWYAGDDVNTPDAPDLGITFPDWCCGAIDFGTLPDGTVALVEYNHPFACGWYGKDIKHYMEWLACGWNFMTKGYGVFCVERTQK